jgi:hypothetical protein
MTRFIAIAAFTLLLVGCGKPQVAQISDVTKPATLTLTPAPGQSTSVHAFWLRIRGKIDGSADIWGTDLQSNRFTGKFEMTRSGDYYATNCVIEYRPVGVRTGKVSIEYKFRCVD